MDIEANSPTPASHGVDYDVAILGSGIGGTLLASILARHKARVLVIEKGQHPRFALGESTIRETSEMLNITAARFDVPELNHISGIRSVTHRVSSSCGVKKNFGFLYHRPGQAQKPEESTQIPVPDTPYGYELHMFRQDIDSYMLAVAIRYGATVRQKTEVQSIDFADESVELCTTGGEQLKARFLVDASGYQSPLAKKFGLRSNAPQMRTHSRALFTHMVGVRPYHAFGHSLGAHGLPSDLSEGTLHHIFDGGWLWLIPFGNRPHSTNPLCSVGLNLDPRRFPVTGESAADEFQRFLEKFPGIAPHFEGARAVRSWTSTGRLQYSSKQVVGDRWAMLAYAAGAVDALFSRGLYHTVASVDAIAEGLLAALKDDVFSAVRFGHIEETILCGIDYNDRIASTCYTAFRDFELWSAWYRIYGMGAFLESMRLTRAYFKFIETGDQEFLRVLHHCPFRTIGGGLDSYHAFFLEGQEIVERVEADELSTREAIKRLYGLHAKVDFIPPTLKLSDPNRRYLSNVNKPSLALLIAWGKTVAPKYMRERFFDFKLSVLAKEQVFSSH